MKLVAYGVNHKTAPLEVREKVAVQDHQQDAMLLDLIEQPAIYEAVILSTCNRTELYCVTDDSTVLLQWLAKTHQLPIEKLDSYTYSYHEEDAIQHTMRVACGLDSMMLGEVQILGQMKQAYAKACEAGTIGKKLRDMFQHVFNASKKVRSETDIGVNPLSIAHAGINLTKNYFNDLSQVTALFIGAGNTIELCTRYCQKQGVTNFLIANRTLENAERLATVVGGKPLLIGQIPDYLPQADIVVTATACPLPFLGKGTVESALRTRSQKPMFMLDLAVPRDIESEVAELENATLVNIDDLREIVDDNLQSRLDAAQLAEDMITAELENYTRKIKSAEASEVIRQYRTKMEALGEREVERALLSLQQGETPEFVMRDLSRRLIKKLAHQPSVQLREASADGRSEIIDFIQYLYAENQ